MDIKRLQELSGVSQPPRDVVASTTANIITENTNRMRALGGIDPLVINEGIVDGHEYNFSKSKTNSGYQLTVTNADDTEIGKIEVDDNMEQIHYERDDGEQGSLNYWEFSNKSNVEDSLAKWLAGTDG